MIQHLLQHRIREDAERLIAIIESVTEHHSYFFLSFFLSFDEKKPDEFNKIVLNILDRSEKRYKFQLCLNEWRLFHWLQYNVRRVDGIHLFSSKYEEVEADAKSALCYRAILDLLVLYDL